MGRIILPPGKSSTVHGKSIAVLEIELRQKGRHLKDLVVGPLMYEGKRCYGVSFEHGGKKWELTMATTPDARAGDSREPRDYTRMIEEGKRHLLETVLNDIEKRFQP